MMQLHSAGDLAAAEAPSAGIHVDRLAVYDRLDTLNIGLPGPIGTPMRMADLDAVRNALVTEFTFCHLPHLLKRFLNSHMILAEASGKCKCFFEKRKNPL